MAGRAAPEQRENAEQAARPADGRPAPEPPLQHWLDRMSKFAHGVLIVAIVCTVLGAVFMWREAGSALALAESPVGEQGTGALPPEFAHRPIDYDDGSGGR
jgi:hypothetical protein